MNTKASMTDTQNLRTDEITLENNKKGLFWETPLTLIKPNTSNQADELEIAKQNMQNIIQSHNQKRENQALQADITTESELPDLPNELAYLPTGLGCLQNYIFSTMTYPCRYTAGWVAITTMTAFVQTNTTIQSNEGLSLNEYYLTLAPTGFGKEAMRAPLNKLLNILTKENNYHLSLPTIEYSAPSSKQGLHQVLQNTPNHSVYIQSDEFAEWLKSTSKDTNKASVLEYLMQIYTKGLSIINPGRAITTNYTPVQNPRLSLFATTTAESLLTTINRAYAEMGTYNRWVIFLAPKKVPEKNYDHKNYEPPKEVVTFIKWLAELPPTSISMENARDCYIHYDKNFAEPIRQQDGLLGNRLTEQTIKLAGLFALSSGRTFIESSDLELAYKIRLGLYHRSKALIEESNTMSKIPEINEAFEQIKRACIKYETLYISSFSKRSRMFDKLKLQEQEIVIKTLISRGIIEKDSLNKSRIRSLIYKKNE